MFNSSEKMRWRYLFLLVILSVVSCKQMKKAGDLLSGLSEKERYQKENNISDELFAIWEERLQNGLQQKIQVDLPHYEYGRLFPRDFNIYSYQFYLMPGEVIDASVFTDSSSTRMFLELYKQAENTDTVFEKLSIKHNSRSLEYEVKEPGLYKLLIQPEIEANSEFEFFIKKTPAYEFPVFEGKNADIGSYWGDIRGGGSRSHEGIDIFASRGTPVIAASSGRAGFTGEKGLGGKQVWVRDTDRNQSIYYAHLDSIVPNLGSIRKGDTLGFVGNTGNARTTPPHLHFGIYKWRGGAINPIGFVYRVEEAEKPERPGTRIPFRIETTSSQNNLRNKPASGNSKILKKGSSGETMLVKGKSADWLHVRDTLDQSYFVHESIVRELD